jgi:hypothetical protein
LQHRDRHSIYAVNIRMNISELDSYDLGDAVKFNDKLNPRIWGADEKMRPEVREQLLRIADDFREFLGIDVEVQDITVSGSNASYTYTPHSDIDLHLVVDLPKADESEVYRELFDAKKYAYNDQHDIRIGGYDVELYVQDANKKHISQGIYSVMNNDWVSVPKRRRPDVDDISVKSKFEDLGHRIEQAVASKDYEKISDLATKLKDYRQSGLDAHGEFGPENLAFKILRTQGLIKKLYDARNAAKDQDLSLDERRKKRKKKVKYGYGGYWYPGTAYAGQDHPAGSEGGDGGGDGGGESVREDAGMTWDGVNPTTDMFTSEDATMTWDGVNPSTAMFTTETEEKSDEEILRDFIGFCVKKLRIEQMPRVKLRRDPQWPTVHKTFGRYNDEAKTLEVAWGQRHIMDVLRTVAHELTHKHQHEREGERMGPDAGETGSPYENEANARAGVLMRDYGRLHPEYFSVGQAHDLEESASGYIPTRAQAKDPRYSMALTVDIKPGQVGKEANKLKLKTDKQGHPQIARANGLFENLYREYTEFKKKAEEDYSPDEPPGPEFKPTMPAGTLRVDVSDVYDWYKLGQHISNLKGLGRHDFGAGPPSSIISFGDEDTEHKFIDQIRATGLDVTDIDPADPKKRPGKTIKTDPTYNVNEDEDLDEVKMSPGALEKFAASDAAKGIRAGFEAELIFRDTTSDSEDEEMEPDYDADERAYSISQVIEFFENDEYGYGLSDRQRNRLEEQLDETYMNWRDEQMTSDFRNDAEDLVREVYLNETPMGERIIKVLTDGMEIDDAEADKILALGVDAPKFNSSSEQAAYAEQNPNYRIYLEAADDAEAILDEEVETSIEQQDGYYDQALDDYRDNYSGDDDSFFSDVGLRWMSDIANEFNLDWPYWTGGGGSNNGSRSWDEIGNELAQIIDMPVVVSSNYHSTRRREGQWIIEPDGSLDPDDKSEEAGLEIVSPPMPLLMAIAKLKEVTDWANDPNGGNAYTNRSTGLHMGVSLPIRGGDVDYVKLILFMGDKYVLDTFGREANSFTASALGKLQQNIKGGKSDPAGVIKLLQHGLTELAFKELQKGVGTSKYTSAHLQNGYIEFRSPGGDWLAKTDEEIGVLENTMMRFARAMQIAGDPGAERQEYAKKLYKLVTADNEQYADQLRLFSEYSAGTIDKEQLKKQWAEKTIGTERKTNQRWKLYDRATGEPVPGQEYNGYTEEEARARAKGTFAMYDRDFDAAYELRNMSEDQQWEVYDVNTGKTLEIVKGRNKGEAADAVFDKYADQKIGFNVRPYEDPTKLTPRAKLAKRITTKKIDYNYDIIDRRTVDLKVVDRFYATDDKDASETFDRWLKSKGLPSDEDAYGYRKGRQAADDQRDSVDIQRRLGVQDVDTDVAQNFNQPQDATDIPRNWEFVNRINGQVIHNMSNASYNQANVVQDNLETRYPDADIYLRSVSNLEEHFVNESIDPISGAGAVPPRPVIKKKSTTDKVQPVEPVVRSQAYRSAIGQAISQQDLKNMTQQIQVARKLGDSVMEMEDTPPEVLRALDQAAQKNGYRNWADVKANPKSESAVMNVAKLANTILRTTGPHHEKVFYKSKTDENFADGKVSGKSRPGRVKRAGASCSGSVTDLRARAKKYGGEKGRMYHWCANMKSGRKK